MGKLEIRIYPDKVLRKKALGVKRVGEKERQLASSMIETMRSANGVGLAAPQLGVSRRIIVVDDMENKNNNSPYVFFNPRIIKKKGRSTFCEGCLSVPDVTHDVVRAKSVVLEALDLKGDKVKMDTGGILARILQHEIDHLDGILFIDRVGFLKRKRILKEISTKVCVQL
ncbi:MAG: peptide deformylase [Candidatus Omnitrophica bacterium]|nr:peptide deformylase [Candidatus Omnitrophota bacterium]MBU4589847.1 peptide deformylase [Candidatus Omnitrophota bacterium]